MALSAVSEADPPGSNMCTLTVGKERPLDV